MGFRYIEGPDGDLFRFRFQQGIEEFIPKTLGAWRSRDLLRQDKTAMTKNGLLFLNTFLSEAFQELEESCPA
jgi:oxygen-independent coproporphyrinogen-3 oxidase